MEELAHGTCATTKSYGRSNSSHNMITTHISSIATAEDEAGIRRGPWTVDEDLLLVNYIAQHGEGRWNSLARSAGLRRTGKSCRLRWLNYLRPDVRRGNITPEEQLLILELHSRWGNRWSKIAQYLPGRTDNEIKNYWRTRVLKHAKQMQCDVNSKQFRDLMRYLWMPRLLQRIQYSISTDHNNSPTLGRFDDYDDDDGLQHHDYLIATTTSSTSSNTSAAVTCRGSPSVIPLQGPSSDFTQYSMHSVAATNNLNNSEYNSGSNTNTSSTVDDDWMIDNNWCPQSVQATTIPILPTGGGEEYMEMDQMSLLQWGGSGVELQLPEYSIWGDDSDQLLYCC